MFPMRKMVEQQRLVNDPQAGTGKIAQETVEIATTVSQPPTQPVEGQTRHQCKLDFPGRDDRQIRRRFSHAKRVAYQPTGLVVVKNHAVVFFWDDTRQGPALLLSIQQWG